MLPGQEVDRKFVNSVNPLVILFTPSVCEVTGWRRRRKIKGRRLFLFFIVCGCRLYDLLHDVIGIESSSIGMCTRLRVIYDGLLLILIFDRKQFVLTRNQQV